MDTERVVGTLTTFSLAAVRIKPALCSQTNTYQLLVQQCVLKVFGSSKEIYIILKLSISDEQAW